MSRESNFEIEEVHDREAAWPELKELFLGFEDYNTSFLARALRPDWEERLKSHWGHHDDQLILLARAGDGAVGYLVAEMVRDRGIFLERPYVYISHAFVQPRARRLRLGRSLFARAEDWARYHRAAGFRLDVYTQNELGVQFWEGVGFETVSFEMRMTLEEGQP